MKGRTLASTSLVVAALLVSIAIGNSAASPAGQKENPAAGYSLPAAPAAEPVCTADELEPNDSAGTATAAGDGTIPDLSICEGDRDWFVITIPPGYSLGATITFTHTWGDLDLRLMAADGQTMLTSSAGVDNHEAVSWTNPAKTTATVYLEVFHFQTGANPEYTLTLESICARCFSYQGVLADGNGPLRGEFDLAFRLYEGPVGGTTVGGIAEETLNLADGSFTARPDLGDSAGLFQGETRYLEVAVRASGTPTYTTLAPRQPLLPVPAAYSVRWEGVAEPPPGLADGDHHWPAASGAPAAGSTFTVAGSTGHNSGADPAGTLGSDGLPVFSFYDVTDGDLMLLHCLSPDCAEREMSTVDSSGNVGQNSDIAIGTDGFPIISYYDVGNSNLKIAKCHDLACATATITSLDITSAGDSGRFSAIGTDHSGFPVVAYQGAGGTLHLAHCSGSACTGAAFTNTGHAAYELDMVISTHTGEPFVAFRTAAAGGEVGIFACRDSCTTSFYGSTPGEAAVGTPAILVRPGGNLAVFFYDTVDAVLSVLHCRSWSCNAGYVQDLFAPGATLQTAATMGSNNLGLLVGIVPGTASKLWILNCENERCTELGSFYQRSDNYGQPEDIAVVVRPDGVPLVATYDAAFGSLDLTDCANRSCIPYWRP